MTGRDATTAHPDRSRPPAPESPRPLQLPEIESFRLSSGIPVHVLERPDLPEVSLRVLLEAGAAAEPVSRSGISELTGRLLTEGAAGRSAQAMARWLDRMGASFSVQVGHDVAMVSMHLLRDTLPDALDYLRATLRSPAFEADEVARVRKERLDQIERDQDEPSSVADEAVDAAVFGGHPYGRPADGLYPTVAALEADDVARYHGERYVARGTAVIACGDVETGELRAALEERFGDWPEGGAPPSLEEVPDEPAAEADLVLVDRPGSAQSEIRFGGVGIARSSDDFYAVQMANAILGGLFNSRLNMNLREDKGWTYGARSGFSMRRGRGPFVARAAVDTPVTVDAFREMASEIRSLSREPPDDQEMALARNALTLSLPRQFETVSQVSRKIATQVVYGLPDDYWERYRDRVEAVTVDDVTSVAERYLDDAGLVRVAVGDASRVAGELEELGTLEVRP